VTSGIQNLTWVGIGIWSKRRDRFGIGIGIENGFKIFDLEQKEFCHFGVNLHIGVFSDRIVCV
jgi:hypothetical protein